MKKLITLCVTGLLSACFLNHVHAQIITTVAGCGLGDDSMATRAELHNPDGITRDSLGNTYIAQAGRIRKISPSGIITTIAGNGLPGYSGDGGLATAAKLGDMYGVAVDRIGNVYAVDNSYNCIRKIDTAGIITTVAGNGTAAYSGDGGPAALAKLNQPIDILIDKSGNLIFTDWGNYRVRKIDTSGTITTIVGDGSENNIGNNGPAAQSELGDPFRIAMDDTGNLYVADVQYQRICKVDTFGVISIIADITGNEGSGTEGDGGLAINAIMSPPCGLAVDTAGNIYFSDIDNNRIRKISQATGIISNYAGTGVRGYGGDGGPATAAQIEIPEGLTCDKAGNLYICDAENDLVREVDASGNMSTFAGQIGLFGSGYNNLDIEMQLPANMITDNAGNIYVADAANSRVLKLDMSTGSMSVAVGSGIEGYSGDNGPAINAELNNPRSIALDKAGNMYVADEGNNVVRKVDASGTITTFAGNGTAGFADNNVAIHGELNEPMGVAADTTGNVYIADLENNRVRRVDANGALTTFAGTDMAGYGGDGGQASLASLHYPIDVATDAAGNVYITDNYNECIRKVDATGIITTIAGNGTAGFLNDGGIAIGAELKNPIGIRLDNAGNLYIADYGNDRVRLVTTDGIINTVAGSGLGGFSGDGGPAIDARLSGPTGMAIDNNGNLLFSDFYNNRIRKVSNPLAVPKVIAPGSEISVYPNPTSDVINIVNAANCNATVFDMVGKEVIAQRISSAQQGISIGKLASGIYLLQLTSDNGVNKTIKITKE